MKQPQSSQNSRRPRGHRGGRRPNSQGGRNTNFESNGPEGKIRGNAHQVIDKYQALARDAMTLGDRIAAENYFQHAEHYFRVLSASSDAKAKQTNGVRRSNGHDGANGDAENQTSNGPSATSNSSPNEKEAIESPDKIENTSYESENVAQDKVSKVTSSEEEEQDEGLMRALGKSDENKASANVTQEVTSDENSTSAEEPPVSVEDQANI